MGGFGREDSVAGGQPTKGTNTYDQAMALFKPVDKTKVKFKTLGPSLWDLSRYAEMYWEAARQLAGNEPGDSLAAFPMAFLYRHALELTIKAILVGQGPITGKCEDEVLKISHRLAPHTKDLRKVVEHHRLIDGCDYHFRDLEKLIKEWEALDPDGMALRYSVKKDGNTASNERLEKVRIDAVGLSRDMDRALNFLFECLDEIDRRMYQDILDAEKIK
jgi:hypothetical protein